MRNRLQSTVNSNCADVSKIWSVHLEYKSCAWGNLICIFWNILCVECCCFCLCFLRNGSLIHWSIEAPSVSCFLIVLIIFKYTIINAQQVIVVNINHVYLTFSLSPAQQTHEQEQHAWFFSHAVCHHLIGRLWVQCVLHRDVYLSTDRPSNQRQDAHLCVSVLMKATITTAERYITDSDLHVC